MNFVFAALFLAFFFLALFAFFFDIVVLFFFCEFGGHFRRSRY